MHLHLLLLALLAFLAPCNALSLRATLTNKLQEQPLAIADTNLGQYNTQTHIDAREAAARKEVEFIGAGTKPGLELWRVENTRTANDTPNFGIKRIPPQNLGSFYTGDSYLLLHSFFQSEESSALRYDLHFWLGTTSSLDEIGVAAYKAVELDDFLHGAAVQHRELQGFESALFLSYFPQGLVYLDGGIDSGFRAGVRAEEYEARLFQVQKQGYNTNAFEVAVRASSLNQDDAFVLDAGVIVYVFVGESASAFERSKAGLVAHNLVNARSGKSRLTYELDAQFWQILGGSAADVRPSSSVSQEAVKTLPVQLYKLSDLTGPLVFSKIAQDAPIPRALLDSHEVFVLDAGSQLVIWLGKLASWTERSQAMGFTLKYLKSTDRPYTLPITIINEGNESGSIFTDLVK